jgi:hypothetical protein
MSAINEVGSSLTRIAGRGGMIVALFVALLRQKKES